MKVLQKCLFFRLGIERQTKVNIVKHDDVSVLSSATEKMNSRETTYP